MSNNFFKQNFIGLLALLVAIGLGVHSVKSTQTRKFAFVDSQRLMTGFKEAQKLDKELKDEDAKWRGSLKAMEDSIKAYMDTMTVKYDKGDAKAKKEMQDELSARNQKSNNFERFQVKRMQDLMNKKMAGIFEKVNAFMKEYGRAQGYEIIFGTVNGSVLYGEGTAADITTPVVEALNKRYE